MENASKALLIAGAILIAIVLISLGVMILGQGSDSIKNNSGMSDAELSAYNSEFEAFTGSNVKGSTVRQLVSKVNQHNRSNKDDKSRWIGVEKSNAVATSDSKEWGDNETSASVAAASSFASGYSYTVKAQYNSGGLISNLVVTQNGTTGTTNTAGN